MEEYIRTLLEQIRSKKAKTMVEKEIRNHMEEQVKANETAGMTKENAVKAAIEDMGDPVETGISLDRIHRPQAAWGMIFIMAAVSIITILIHVAVGIKAGEAGSWLISDYAARTGAAVCIGFFLMLFVYRLDYSFMAGYAKIIAGVFLGILFLEVFVIGASVNGAKAWMAIPGIGYISIINVMFLYVPIYGALLYQYHETGYGGIFKSILWMVVPVFIALRIPCTSLGLYLLFMMSVLLVLAVLKGWFLIDKKKFLIIYISALILVPILLVAVMMKTGMFTSYQQARIMFFLRKETSEYNYVGNLLKEYTAGSHLFGGSGNDVIGFLPEYNSAYILTFLSSYYGMAAAILICALLAFLVAKVFQISLRQKNQLGSMMGLGCGLVFLVNLMINIASNLGLMMPAAQTFLPFFSYGGTGIVVSYILMGIVLSVYRYKKVLPAHPERNRKKLKLYLEWK